MANDERLLLAAPCGIDCGLCSLNRCKDDPALMEGLVSRGIPREKLPCAGCRNVAGNCPVIGGTCETYACIQRKRVDFCFACDEFPCSKLCPASQRADTLPHNLKVFNLCTIRRTGVEAFVKDSGHIENLYFKGTMEIGKGPKLTG
jgi:hypothetical protein